jgi:hypothetical protein
MVVSLRKKSRSAGTTITTRWSEPRMSRLLLTPAMAAMSRARASAWARLSALLASSW